MFQYISCYSLSIKTMVSVGIRKVSIHLMLLFIGLLQSNSEPHSPFQYISCYSLSVTGNTYGAKDVRFNTSHVTLYRKTIQYPQYPFCRFQYISCYSLSFAAGFFGSISNSFQYISCYSLSSFTKRFNCCRLWFQYISCYSLSKWEDVN